LLVGALLNRNVIDKDKIFYNLFNPSIADYVLSSYMDDINYLDELLSCLETKEAINNIYSLYKSGGINKEFFSSLVEMQILRISNKEDNYKLDEYLLTLLFISSSEIEAPKDGLLNYIIVLSEAVLTMGEISGNYKLFEFINWSIRLQLISESDLRLKNLLAIWVDDIGYDHEEFVSLSKLVIGIEPNGDGELTSEFKRQFVDYLSDDITRDAIESGILSDAYDHSSYSEDELFDFVAERLSDVSVEFEDSDIEEISAYCDIDEIIHSNMNAAMHDERVSEQSREARYSSISSTSLIDDLFGRG
jgi:hypothetical protein